MRKKPSPVTLLSSERRTKIALFRDVVASCPMSGFGFTHTHEWMTQWSSKRRSSVLKQASFTCLEVYRADKIITPTHNAGDLLIALALPGLGRISLVPGLIKLLVLTRQAQVVLLAHVEVGAGDHAANGRARHDLFRLEIHLRQARTVLAFLLGYPAKAEVAAVAIHFADAGHQVMQVCLDRKSVV